MFVLNCDSNDVVDNDDNQTKNLIHLIKQARNVCNRGIKPPCEGGLIGTHFAQDIMGSPHISAHYDFFLLNPPPLDSDGRGLR